MPFGNIKDEGIIANRGRVIYVKRRQLFNCVEKMNRVWTGFTRKGIVGSGVECKAKGAT